MHYNSMINTLFDINICSLKIFREHRRNEF